LNAYIENIFNMKTNFELLKEYFNNTPKDILLKEWEETKECDKVGPSAKKFIYWTEKFFRVKNLKSPWTNKQQIKETKNPEYFTSGFFSTYY